MWNFRLLLELVFWQIHFSLIFFFLSLQLHTKQEFHCAVMLEHGMSRNLRTLPRCLPQMARACYSKYVPAVIFLCVCVRTGSMPAALRTITDELCSIAQLRTAVISRVYYVRHFLHWHLVIGILPQDHAVVFTRLQGCAWVSKNWPDCPAVMCFWLPSTNLCCCCSYSGHLYFCCLPSLEKVLLSQGCIHTYVLLKAEA